MLLKWTRETYARYVSDPASDPVMAGLPAHDRSGRIARNQMMSTLLAGSRPFVIEKTALELLSTLSFPLKKTEDLGPMLLEAPLPFPALWFEYEDMQESAEGAPQNHQAGALIRKTEGRVFACSFHRLASGLFAEPTVFVSAEAGGKLDIVLNPHTAPILIERMEGTREDRMGQLFSESLAQTAWTLRSVVSAAHLISSRAGPLEISEKQMLSRPERRRLEREGFLPKGAAPTFTRIGINEQGRLHLQAIDEEEGGAGGARRRAHRVRGHFMRTAKGIRWRTEHIRGFGEVNETVRTIGAAAQGER